MPHAPRPAEAHCDLFNRDFDTLHAEASAYWNRKLTTAATISLPEQRIDEVARAGLLHLDMITYGQREGTLGPAVGSYSPIGTESAPIIQYFDSMGWHDVARRCIQYFLEKQHDNGFMQNFFDYMPETGAVLWTMGEHYLYTRDDAWARDVERSVKKACEWIVERRHADSPEGVGRGMIVGKVADPVDEYRSFMLNSYQYMGLTAAAVLLQNVDPEAAERYTEEAGRFGADIRRALKLARERSPVVPLGDGRYVPSSPPWAEGTGFNAFGYDGNSAYSHETVYVKDSLLGPLYAAFAGVIPPAGPLAGEMLEAHHEHMTQDGIALSQPYYSCHPFLNLRRGETKAFLGAFYTGLASIADRETYTFWEHHFGVSTHKTHEEGWFLLQLRQMLYLETADELRLVSAIPRTYLESGKRVRLDGARSHFGPLFVTIESRTDSGRIDATVSCPEGTARGLRRVTLRLRTPTAGVLARPSAATTTRRPRRSRSTAPRPTSHCCSTDRSENGKRVLAVGAHPDDVGLLCGGTLAKCAERGDQVFIAAATAAMLLEHASQDEWLRGLHDDVDGIEQLMTAQTRHRGLEAGCRYAEGFSELKTYPRTGSYSLLP